MKAPTSPVQRLAIKLSAVILIVSVVVMFNCSDQALFAALGAALIMAGEATVNDVFPWLSEDEGRGDS